MISSLFSPREVGAQLGARLMALRLDRDWRRSTLAERAGVSVPTIARFETRGQITLENLLKLAQALGVLGDFDSVFARPPARSIADLEREEAWATRRRGRR